jgi:hypothetical protein
MTVREFNGTSDELVTSIGAASDMTYGTAAMLLKFSTLSGFREFCMIHSASNTYVANPIGLSDFSAWQVDYNNGGADFATSAPIPGTGIWILVIARKPAGSSTPRLSMYNYSTGAWTHGDGSGAVGDGTAPGTDAFIRFSYLGSSLFFGGRVAARALWSNSLPWAATSAGDTAIETSGLNFSAYNWKQNSPTLFHLFNQSDTSTPVSDLSTAGTATQTSISGTTVITGDDPPGFSFSLTQPQPLLAWNFDEASGAVLDLSGNGRTWTPGAGNGNSARTSSGGGHTSLGMTQSIADIATGPSLTGLTTDKRTVMAWVKQTSTITGWLLEFHVSSIDSGSWGILFLSGQVHIQARNSSGFVRASGATPSANVWHHIAGTYDGTNVRLYIDGTLTATVALTAPMRTDANTFRVMDQASSLTVWDDARLFDTALSQSEIQTQMNTPVTGAPPSGPNIYFFSGAQATAVYEMTAGGVLVQRNNLITIK